MGRPARAEIDLSALRHNFQLARRLTGKRIMSVIKANAYGHGAVPVARTLEQQGTDALAVACIEEALVLREAGIRSPIVLLQGFYESSELPLVAQNSLSCVVHHRMQVEAIKKWQGSPLDVWLKIDTGMHRLGFLPQEAPAVYKELKASPAVGQLVLMTHFGCADEPDNPATLQQARQFQESVSCWPEATCLSNSAAILLWPESPGDWIRPGLLLYGASPFSCAHPLADSLRPVMKVSSALFAVRQLEAGMSIGYGQTYTAQRPTRVGVVAIGYADGYPRHAPNGTPVLVAGERARLCGRVSMDMLMVDLESVPHARVGDPVELWGPGLPVSEVAESADTIPYELFCNVKRVPLSYINGEDLSPEEPVSSRHKLAPTE